MFAYWCDYDEKDNDYTLFIIQEKLIFLKDYIDNLFKLKKFELKPKLVKLFQQFKHMFDNLD